MMYNNVFATHSNTVCRDKTLRKGVESAKTVQYDKIHMLESNLKTKRVRGLEHRPLFPQIHAL